MLKPTLSKNDKKANLLIGLFSAVVFIAVVVLSRIEVDVDLGFDKHIFARLNAGINSTVSLLLILSLIAVKSKKYVLHKNITLTAMGLSVLFLVSYIAHHLFTGETKFGGEGSIRYVYYFILTTHIILAAVILPFILFAAYRAMTGEYERHKKIVKITWPVWLYVSLTGVIVYFMISPYYQ
jgi:putative membrane protein